MLERLFSFVSASVANIVLFRFVCCESARFCYFVVMCVSKILLFRFNVC